MINLQGVSLVYSSAAGQFLALRGIDFTIERGEFVAIVGKSGSGKSTLLNLIGGIDRMSTGTITVSDRKIGALSENELAKWRGRSVGFVFQFFQLLPTLTIAENVMLPMDFASLLPARQRRPRALELLGEVGIRDQADKLPTALSGGQQQRAAIARALANDPVVVLADEPTGNLDSTTARAVLELLRGLADRGTTVIIATHERDISELAHRTVELTDGMISRVTQRGANDRATELAR